MIHFQYVTKIKLVELEGNRTMGSGAGRSRRCAEGGLSSSIAISLMAWVCRPTNLWAGISFAICLAVYQLWHFYATIRQRRGARLQPLVSEDDRALNQLAITPCSVAPTPETRDRGSLARTGLKGRLSIICQQQKERKKKKKKKNKK